MKNNRTTKNLAFAGMFMALTMVFTVIHIPLAIGNINFGDAVILLSAACLPLPFSVASSAIGAALADVFTGYASYAPFTLVVKALVALIAKLMLTALKNAKPAVKYPISAIPAELVMAGGYFLANSFLLEWEFKTAATSVPFDLLQGAVAVVVFTLLAVVAKIPEKVGGYLTKE